MLQIGLDQLQGLRMPVLSFVGREVAVRKVDSFDSFKAFLEIFEFSLNIKPYE